MGLLSSIKACYLVSEINDVQQSDENNEAKDAPNHDSERDYKFCMKCGKKIPATSKYCPYCGECLVSGEIPVQETAAKETTEKETVAPEKPMQEAPTSETAAKDTVVKEVPEKKKSSKSKTILFVAAGVVLLLVIASIIFVPIIQKNMKYNDAIREMENGNYEEAISAFTEMSFEGYKDSDKYLVYAGALQKYDEGKYDEAIDEFELVYDFEDSENYITLIEALMSIEVGDYESASSILETLPDFVNAQSYKKYCDAIIAYKNKEYPKARELFNDLLSGNVPDNMLDDAGQMISLIDAIGKFDNGDDTCKDSFAAIAESDSVIAKREANKYLDYIRGNDYLNQGLFYSAYECFMNSGDIKDSKELMDRCFQVRPESGIIYRNTTSGAVSVTIYDTQDDDDMFVKIYDQSDNLIETMYIRDGSNSTAYFQSGTFRMAIAYGSPEWWFGPEEAYGDFGSYKRLLLNNDEEYFSFRSNMIYTLRFNVVDGNVNDITSDYGDF